MWLIETLNISRDFIYFQKIFNILALPWIKYFSFLQKNFINFYKFFFLNIKISKHKFDFKLLKTKYIINKHYVYKPTKLLNFFIKLTNSSTQGFYRVHPSQRFNYIYNVNSASYIFNLMKFSKYWLNLYNLLYQIFFYKISFLTFNSPFFKRENLSFNWKFLKVFKNYWKFSELTVFFSKHTNLQGLVFTIFFLMKYKINIIILLNALLRKNILKFFHKYKFYSIGVVPINTSLYSVNFAIPIGNDNIFMELFLIRFILQIHKYVNWTHIQFFKKIWTNYSYKCY